MPIEVVDSDGTVIEFPDDTAPATITSVMRRRDQDRQARARAGANGPGGVVGRIAGEAVRDGPQTPYQRAYSRRTRERAPQGRPGTFLRALEDFNRGPLEFLPQMFRNMGVADEAAAATEYLRSGGDPEAARAGADYERNRQRQVAREQPGVNAASIAASIPAFGGNPVMAARNPTMVEAGLATAGINAPFALARPEGSLQERLAPAAQESALAFGLGAGGQGLANMLTRAPRPNTTPMRAQEFEEAGVRAPLAALQQRGSAPLAMAIAENPIGGNVRRHLQNSADDVAAASRRITERAGPVEPREIAGEAAQRGVRRFAQDRSAPAPSGGDPRSIPVRDWTFAAKANALYDDVFARLADDEMRMVGAVEGPILDLSATMRTFDDIERAVHGPASRAFMESSELAEMRRALQSDDALGELRFQDLRRWRTWVREAQRSEGLRQSIGQASLQRLERSLTEDIYASAMNIGGVAAHDLRRVDQWYRAGQQRIQAALQPFDNASGGAQAMRRIIDLATQGGRQNTRQLSQLRASLRPDEWRVVSASIMDELGNPRFGAPNVMEPGAFSLESFVTNVARLSPDGRRILFGALADDIERLARVAGSLKQVRGFTNYSRSGSSFQNISTLGVAGGAIAAAGAGNMAPLAMLAAAGLTARVTGEMLTNPGFVRWLTKAGAGGMRRQLAGLSQLASRDPALMPLYSELVQHAAGRSQPEAGRGDAPASRQPASAAR